MNEKTKTATVLDKSGTVIALIQAAPDCRRVRVDGIRYRVSRDTQKIRIARANGLPIWVPDNSPKQSAK